jgi:ribonuclease HII
MSTTTGTQAITLHTRHIQDEILEAGIDEAGRGCFWGPLTAGAVILPAEADWSDKMRTLAPKLRDSKKLSPKRRAEYATAIKELAIAWGVGMVMAADLDAHGVTWANQTAFERAAAALQTKPGRLLIDGTLACKYEGGEVCTIIDGDATYLSIAAASILAKEAHDDWVRDFCAKDPTTAERFGFATNKGYGTAKHRAALKEHNPHEEHRQRFIYGGGASSGGYKRREADSCQIMMSEEEERGALQM